jgi:hypothetical protein
MNIIKLVLISLFSINGLTLTNILVDRRSVIAGTLFSQTVNDYNTPKSKNINNLNNIDYYAHWSVYGLVPPPIEKSITKKELIKEIDNENIISLQIAVQHDCVIATTKANHRLSVLIKDKDFDNFVNQFRDKDNSLPFKVIPVDKNRQKLRNFAQLWLGLYVTRFFAYELPKNIKLLNSCNSSMTTRQKMLFLLDNQNDIIEVFRNSSKV